MRNVRQSEAASRSARASKHQVVVCDQGGRIYRANIGGTGGEYRLFEDPNLQMRNARQPGAASHSDSVFMHKSDVCGHGGHAHRRYLGEPGGEYRLF